MNLLDSAYFNAASFAEAQTMFDDFDSATHFVKKINRRHLW